MVYTYFRNWLDHHFQVGVVNEMSQFVHGIANHLRFLDFQETDEAFRNGGKVEAVVLPVYPAAIVINILHSAEPIDLLKSVESKFIRGLN